MFKQAFTPPHRGFDEHMGYYQGCESHYTHVSACCGAGSAYNDTKYVCPHGKGKDMRGYDWFKNSGGGKDSTPDLSAAEVNS